MFTVSVEMGEDEDDDDDDGDEEEDDDDDEDNAEVSLAEVIYIIYGDVRSLLFPILKYFFRFIMMILRKTIQIM